MNYLAIDFGTKTIGLAYTINGIIFTLKPIQNNNQLFPRLEKIVADHSIGKIYLGLSDGAIVPSILKFADQLHDMLKLPVETVEETASTIEAVEIYKHNLYQSKKIKDSIDSIAAAVILKRVINFK